jgi:hypothetical protein
MAQEEAVSNQWSAVSRSEEEDTGKSAGATQIKKKQLPTLTLGHVLFRY